MSFLQDLGKVMSFIGNAQDFLPNKVLSAVGLPDFTSPMHMGGDFLKDPKKFQFGREFGNNTKLGAIAAGAYLAGPALLHAFGVGGSGGAGVADASGAGAGISGGNPATANIMGGPPSGLAEAFRNGPMGTMAEDWGADSTGGAATTAGGGPIGPGGNNPGIAGKGASQPGKQMNPILKSFLDNYFQQRMAKPQPQQYQPATFTHTGGKTGMTTYAAG